jgi:hypothetical protein
MSKDPHAKSQESKGLGQSSEPAPDFGKAQGSARNDEADMRDIARKSAKKSQRRNDPSEN